MGYLHPRHGMCGDREAALAKHESRKVRAGDTAGEGAAALDSDQARAACDERDESVQRLQGALTGTTAAEVLQRTALDSRCGEGCAACRGQSRVEGNHEHCAQMSKEARVEGRAEIAPTINIYEICFARCLYNVIVWLLEEDDLVWDKRDNITVDRAA
jgi:hypothetical protein